ncbi:MAG: type IX secretion system membrane protein PorP/SprF [Flavobacteriales bacterium]|nr:type IX secretion system membrane protein PorP/SprF [Flavobacteriales bacterium]
MSFNLKTYLTISFFCLSFLLHAQDPQFTQFYANPLYLNPAFAGTAKCPRLIMNYRNQWPGISGNFVTYNASYDQHLDAINGGFGLLAFHDNGANGTLTTNYIGAIYSYATDITHIWSFRAAIQASFFQRVLDWNKLTFGDMIHPVYGFIYPTGEVQPTLVKSNVDFSSGLLLYSNRLYFGLAAHHVNRPEEGFISDARIPVKFTAHAGAKIAIQRNLKDAAISPNILFKYQGNFHQLLFGFYASKGPIVGGVWFRKDDAFIATLGLEYEMVKIGYSYDITYSSLGLAPAGGSHEISFAYTFPCPPTKRKFRYISCPSF